MSKTFCFEQYLYIESDNDQTIFQLFKRLDGDKDHVLTLHDFEMIEKDKGSERYRKMIQYLEYQTARIEDYIEDLDESQHRRFICFHNTLSVVIRR